MRDTFGIRCSDRISIGLHPMLMYYALSGLCKQRMPHEALKGRNIPAMGIAHHASVGIHMFVGYKINLPNGIIR